MLFLYNGLNRCIEHTLHLMATHFIAALKIPSLRKTKGDLRKAQDSTANADDDAMDDVEEDEDENDVDTNMDVEATGHEVAAIKDTAVTSFLPGDVVGKIMALSPSCAHQVRMYETILRRSAFHEVVLPWRSRFEFVLGGGVLVTVFVSSLSSERYVKHITLKLIYNDSELQAIDDFCVLADNDRDLPPLRRGKKWADYRLSSLEWQIIELARDCLKVSALSSHIFPAEFSYQIVADTHGELSAHKTSTIHMVFPLIEKVQSDWENRCLNPVYAPVKHALEAGLKNMSKWYRKADDTLIYFIFHGMYTCFWLKT